MIESSNAADAFLFAGVLAAVITGGASPNAARAASDPPHTAWLPPACVALDLAALAVIEERGEVIGISNKQVVEAGRRFLLARRLCLAGQQDKGVVLYKSAINAAFGLDPPIVNAVGRTSR